MPTLTCFRCGEWDDATQLCACADRQTIFNAKAAAVFPMLKVGIVDICVADSPYSSGGMMRSDRNMSVRDKYQCSSVVKTYPDFSGDNRDQRSYERWCVEWLERCHEITRNGGAMLSFIDWRNIACMVDALQIAGWVYRGIIPWDKTEQARPQKGWFASQCEFIAAASSGPLAIDYNGTDICQTGFIRVPVDKQKLHVTGKPVALYRELLRTRGDWKTMLDPFLGAGASLVACKELGKRGLGVDVSREYCQITADRLDQHLLTTTAAREQPDQQRMALVTEPEPDEQTAGS